MTTTAVSALSRRRRWGGESLPLADELWCIGHDDRTGRSRLHERVLALGLAAALLGELVLYRRVEVVGGVLRVVSDRPPADALAHAILEQLVAQPQHREVRTWLAFLGDTAVESVARRLVLAGVLQRVEQRRLRGTRVSHVPADVSFVAWRAMRLCDVLTSPAPMSVPDVMLAGLVTVTGLADVVLWQPGTREAGMARIADEVDRLPGPLYSLLACVNAALGDAVLAPR